jgi:polysaccharide deacetylase family protein (PEP-CTERM system associated)
MQSTVDQVNDVNCREQSDICNAFSVDVEDYYHVSGFEHRISRHEWDSYPSRVEHSTRRLLDLLAKYEVKGTFFVLGWIAARRPCLVKEIASHGHEIGSHSYWHRMVHTMSPQQFREDLKQSKQVLEDVCGAEVRAYRAPSFSITRRSQWALEIIAEEGFEVDSSIFPVRHDRYGMPEARTEPHVLRGPNWELLEFPPSVLPLGRYHLPVAGGGYFRALPRAVTYHAIRCCNRRKLPFMFYIHPWELDYEQPRVPGVGWKSRTRHFLNLRRTEEKLHWLLGKVRFGTLGQALNCASPALEAVGA